MNRSEFREKKIENQDEKASRSMNEKQHEKINNDEIGKCKM